MAYIGNAKTPLIFASNTRDDIVPVKNANGTYKAQFLLSQEVPGGYDANVMVLRRQYVNTPLVQNCSLLTLTKTLDSNYASGYKVALSTTDSDLIATLNDVTPQSSSYDGDSVEISGATNEYNNKIVLVIEKNYDGNALELVLENPDLVAEAGGSITLNKRFYAPWEVLEPEADYSIENGGLLSEKNRVIRFTKPPTELDVVYVLHRGDATYNFVPSAKSVGPEQLSDNLRNFVCDRFTVVVDGETQFVLSQTIPSSRSVLVFVDNVITDGDDITSGFLEGDWSLEEDGQTITFKSGLSLGTKVKVWHLGLGTISRRAVFSPGQGQGAILDRSITTDKLAYGAVTTERLADNAVTLAKMADDSVNGSNILLENNQAIRIKDLAGNAIPAIKMQDSDIKITTPANGQILFQNQQNANAGMQVQLSSVLTALTLNCQTSPESFDIITTQTQTLLTRNNADIVIDGNGIKQRFTTLAGTPTLKITPSSGSGFFNIEAPEGSLSTDTVNASLVVADNVMCSNLTATTINNVPVSQVGSPTGTIVMTALDTAPEGWLLCDGQEYDVSTTPALEGLRTAIGTKFGGTGTRFKVPDLRKRFPIGKSSDTLVGDSDGLDVSERNIRHAHDGAPHTHDISHTHTIPGHVHEMVSTQSTLAVTSLQSGDHETSLAHTHDTFTTSEEDLNHRHEFTHGHGSESSKFDTKTESVDHTHSGSTTAAAADPVYSGGAHQNTLYGRSGTPAQNGYPRVSTTISRDSALDNSPATQLSGAHQHAFSTGGASVSHTHAFYINDTAQKFTLGAINTNSTSNKDLKHKHTITALSLPELNSSGVKNKSSSVGYHTHAADHFTGAIGRKNTPKTLTRVLLQDSNIIYCDTTNVFVGSSISSTDNSFPTNTIVMEVFADRVRVSKNALVNRAVGTTVTFSAANGNDELSTNFQNNTSSGTSTASQTGSATSPYLVLNFIIKT